MWASLLRTCRPRYDRLSLGNTLTISCRQFVRIESSSPHTNSSSGSPLLCDELDGVPRVGTTIPDHSKRLGLSSAKHQVVLEGGNPEKGGESAESILDPRLEICKMSILSLPRVGPIKTDVCYYWLTEWFKMTTSSSSSNSSTPTEEQLKEQFIETLGSASYWDEGWRSTLALSPAFFEASLRLRAVPLAKGYLPRKVQHFVALTVDCAATHLYVPGIRADVRAAFAAGATLAEVVEVVELASTLGIHACNVGIPLLVEVMKEEGVYDQHFPSARPPTSSSAAPEWDPYRQRLKDDFTAKRGYWHPTWEDFLRVDPEFFEAYMAFSSVPWTKKVGGSRQGALEPKVRKRKRQMSGVQQFSAQGRLIFSSSRGELDQRADVLRLRRCRHTPIRDWPQVAHEERPGLRRHPPGDRRGARDCLASKSTHSSHRLPVGIG